MDFVRIDCFCFAHQFGGNAHHLRIFAQARDQRFGRENALARLIDDRSWQCALLVLHGGVNRAILSHAEPVVPDRPATESERRAAYWKARGYEFNPRYLTASDMDAAAGRRERSKYWKSKGYTFNSSINYSAPSMKKSMQ